LDGQYSEKLCGEKHKRIEDELTRQAKWLGDHEKKIDVLERSDATNTVQIGNLATSLEKQTKAIWGLVGTVALALIGAGVGFIIWYIQKL
jgi:hypothetical protein